jgi:hypothetical protein
MRHAVLGLALFASLCADAATRSFFTLPTSNGYGAAMADTRTGKVVHFRERLPATEEPKLDSTGNEVWIGNQPQMVATRDLLFDLYFGLRAGGQQAWLLSTPDASGYETVAPSPAGGSGIVTWHQQQLGLDATSYLFAPRSFPHAAFVLALHLENKGSTTISGVGAFSLHNFHLGYGRPGVMTDLAANGETVTIPNHVDVLERAFAGVVVVRALGTVTRTAAWNATAPSSENGYQVVQSGGVTDLVDKSGAQPTGDDWVSADQFDVGTLAPGADAWVAVVVAHHGDPFAGATVQGWLDAWVAGRSAKQVVDDERAAWSTVQAALTVPSGLSTTEAQVFRQSAAVLLMAQARESQAFLREFLSQDGEARRTRFGDGGVTLPATVAHRGQGAVLASLPPGEWTVAWVRDGTFASVALSALGRTDESREALRFMLDAEGGRFQSWTELAPYSPLPYVVSLCRYTGFGVEETDFNGFGPNLELDGLGLVLWALRQHERLTGDTSLTDARWSDISGKIVAPLVALIDSTTGLVKPDSSIWETHWNGRQRTWTWTQAVAARGLCDAAAMAERKGDSAHATQWRQAAQALRRAIARKLTDSSGALASNAEELAAGDGYFDAAAVEALANGLFAPDGGIAQATLSAFDSKLKVAAGPGWSRNDDQWDHSGATDLSPWGSDYDSAEWSFTDLRGAVAMGAAGRATRASALVAWVTDQASSNAGLVPETWDQTSGAWKFNAPMVGFGAGAYVLALAQRGQAVDPACGVFFEQEPPVADAGVTSDAGTTPVVDAGMARDAGVPGAKDAGTADGGAGPGGSTPRGCGCGVGEGSLFVVAACAGALSRRRRRDSLGA